MITRDNYEEFFLLYTDNELSAAERIEVEGFVADHPDLQEEWEAILQTKLSPDTQLGFPDRSSLLKPEIEGSACTGDLLSYIYGELDGKNTARIEAALLQQPLVERELAILRQTVVQPDLAVVFPGKDALYRTEKDRRIIPLPWLRAGIAAAVAGAIALLLLLPARQPAARPDVAVVKPSDSPAIDHKIIPTVTPAPIAALHSMEGQPGAHKDQPVKQLIQRRETQQPQDVAGNNNDVAINNKDVAVDNKDVAVDIVGTAVPHKVDPVAEGHDVKPPTQDLATNIRFAVQPGIPKEQSSFATQALQDEADDDRNNSFIADGSTAPGKGALRGIFRKVKRTFAKTADRDGDGNRQVLVGAFQVSLD